jgi:polysaccharide export outer membrane protein
MPSDHENSTLELLFLFPTKPILMKYGLFFILFCVLISSCTINKNVMFKTDTDYEFDTLDDTTTTNFLISPNDEILFRLFSNEGARLIEMTAGIQEGNQNRAILPSFTYTVQPDGMLELPEIGFVQLAGMTIQDAQLYLEELYSEFYKKPFAVLQIINNRAIVFSGDGGNAAVVPLQNQNMTLIEVLAMAGGVAQRGNASKVKLIRRYDDQPYDVFLMDLSTIEGIQHANMIVQANDVIYVEPVPEIAREILQDISPIVTIISNLALIYAIFRSNL